MPRLSDIPQFTRGASYMVHVGLDYLPSQYAKYVREYGLDVSPDFQRGYVWTAAQKVRFVEYMLRGGRSGLDLYLNCPGWKEGNIGPRFADGWMVLVDGKQRLDAVLGFLNGEFPVFDGHYWRDYEDRERIGDAHFRWHVNDLQTREECLQWYLDMNTGGTVHTDAELDSVRDLLRKGGAYQRPSHEQIIAAGRLDREIIQAAIRERDEQAAAQRERAEEAKAKGRRGGSARRSR